MSVLEVAANVTIALAIFLAGRNNIHTWWIGIIGCSLFAVLFYQSQLYADVTLQGFFIITSLIGWYRWAKGQSGVELPITHTRSFTLIMSVMAALAIGGLYAWLLHSFTDAYAPGWDSLMLVMSVIAQLLLMYRKIENWVFWLIVNTIAVPLFYSRGLELTAVLYAAYWVHAIFAFIKWRKEYELHKSILLVSPS